MPFPGTYLYNLPQMSASGFSFTLRGEFRPLLFSSLSNSWGYNQAPEITPALASSAALTTARQTLLMVLAGGVRVRVVESEIVLTWRMRRGGRSRTRCGCGSISTSEVGDRSAL